MRASEIESKLAAGAAKGEATTRKKTGFWALALGSVGVVYGDIGTSPLYAFREALSHVAGPGTAPSEDAVFGVLSLILWSLILIVSIKYIVILLNADNNGEGGVLSLMALVQRALKRRAPVVFAFGVFGAALFYGDAIITPALSVLSAVEGLKLVTPSFDPYVVPATIAIIFVLFMAQSRGTGKVAALFGPVTTLWFVAMGVAGAIHIGDRPDILLAFNPYHAVRFLTHHGLIGLIALGAVFLAVTGGEALYADLGHFGKKPIRAAWFGLVFPSLALNYLGQGALVLSDPAALANPFFLMVPEWALLPMVGLATAATVIAAQAVITGAFSITRQAIQLGLLPRLEVRHTSEAHAGQIFLPRVNRLMMIGVVLLVVVFGSSSNLASAYGIAVTGTMLIDSCLVLVLLMARWHWPLWGALLLMLPFVFLDSVFMGANLLKVHEGGWMPLMLAGGMTLIIVTWVRGSRILRDKAQRDSADLQVVVDSLERNPPHIVPGTAMFLTGTINVAPVALLHNLKHNKVLHERNVMVTIEAAPEPYVDPDERVSVQSLSPHVMVMHVRYGYMESPHLPPALVAAKKLGLKFDIMQTSFFLGRRSLKASPRSGMPLWQDRLFISLSKNAADATEFFQIPSDRVIELGTQVTI